MRRNSHAVLYSERSPRTISVIFLALLVAFAYAPAAKAVPQQGEHNRKVGATLIDGEVYYDLPEMTLNIRSSHHDASVLKVKITLNLQDEEEVLMVDEILPRILNDAEFCFRDLDQSQVDQPGAMDNLRVEFLKNVDRDLRPREIKDVFFREFLVIGN